MVVALLIMLSLTTWSGLEVYAAEGKGPLAVESSLLGTALANGDDDDREHDNGEDFWEDLHEAFANVTMALVVIHIFGVLFSSLIHRENLIAGMITGYKKKH